MNTRVFRIFLSSTFGDFQAEREALRARVWPRFEDFCRARGGAFQVVDLRWGVSEADGLAHDTLRICLDEIAHCQKLSPKPNFLMFLGDRYGWRPLPTEISVDEFELIVRVLTARPDDFALLQQWYRRDDNAVPSHYRLLPRDDAYQTYAAWGPIEARLTQLLRGAAEELGLTPERRERYFLSATHLEIVHGALKAANTDEHVFGFFRDIDDLASLNPIAFPLTRFSDFVGEELDAEAARLRSELRKEIDDAIPDNHQFGYRCQWNGTPQAPISTDHIDALCKDVEHCLRELISKELGQEPLDPIEDEHQRHLAFASDRVQHFLGREIELTQVHDWLKDALTSECGTASPDQIAPPESDVTDAEEEIPTSLPPMIVHGPGGVGKSAFMARALANIETRFPHAVVIRRFIGASPRSSNLFNFLSDLLNELAKQYKQHDPLPEGGIKVLSDELIQRLGWATAEKPLILMVDALDQFESSSEARHHQWLPQKVPNHVVLIVSVLDGPMLDTARQRLPTASKIALPPFSLSEGAQLLDALLLAGEEIAPDRKRQLTPVQRETVLNAFGHDGRPLYLKLAVPVARRWASWTQPDALPTSLEGMVESMVHHLQAVHGHVIADRALDYLTAARYGVSDDEIRDLLWRDAEAHAEFDQRKNPDQPQVESLPPVIWSRLYFELAPYLTSQSVDGALLHRFFHRVIGEEIAHVCLTDDKLLVHRRIADYFAEQPLHLGEGTDRSPNLRKCMEEPWQRIKAGELERAEALLTNFDFCMAKCEGNRFNDLHADYRLLMRHMHAVGTQPSATLKIWEEFIRTKAHILRRGNAEWPSHKILLQLAIEHAEDSPLTLAAETFLAEGKCDWEWLRNMTRPKKYVPDPCLMVFEGHVDNIGGALVLPNGRLLSWSWDRTMRLWDASTGIEIALLEGHSERIIEAHTLPSGNVISWSWDHSLRIWDISSAAQKTIMKGHTGFVNGALLLVNGNILSWSDDGSLRTWDSLNGAQLSTLEGHTDRVLGAIKLTSGHILSWSADKTLRIWDGIAGLQLHVLEGHSERLTGAVEINDGRLLSWSADKSLRIWDIFTGALLITLEGHQDRIIGARQDASGRVLSWSADKSVRMWDPHSGMQLAKLAGHKAEVKGVLELKSNRILSWSSDNTLRIWDTLSNRLNKTLTGHKGGINGACIFDDIHVLSWSNDKTLRLWDSVTGRQVSVLNGHSSWVMGAIITRPDAIVSWSRDASLRLWDYKSTPTFECDANLDKKRISSRVWAISGGKLLMQGDSPSNGLYLYNDDIRQKPMQLVAQMDFVDDIKELSNDGLLTWSANGEIFLWHNIVNANPVNLVGHRDGLFGAQEVDGDHIITYSEDRTLILWHRQSGRLLQTFVGHEDGIYGAMITSDGLLASWSGDGTIRLWDLREGIELSSTTSQSAVYGAIELNNNYILSWSEDGAFRLWDRLAKQDKLLLKHPFGYISGVKILSSPIIAFWTNSAFASVRDYSLVILNGVSGEVIARLDGHTGPIKSVTQLDDGRVMSLGESEIIVWDENYQIAGMLSNRNANLIFHSDSDIFTMARHMSKNATLEVPAWSLRNGYVLVSNSDNTLNKTIWHGDNNNGGKLIRSSVDRLTSLVHGEFIDITLWRDVSVSSITEPKI